MTKIIIKTLSRFVKDKGHEPKPTLAKEKLER